MGFVMVDSVEETIENVEEEMLSFVICGINEDSETAAVGPEKSSGV